MVTVKIKTKKDLVKELKGQINDFYLFESFSEGIKVKAIKRSKNENTMYLQIPRKLRYDLKDKVRYCLKDNHLIIEVV